MKVPTTQNNEHNLSCNGLGTINRRTDAYESSSIAIKILNPNEKECFF
jgi:hypothetical protein